MENVRGGGGGGRGGTYLGRGGSYLGSIIFQP